MGWYDSIIAFQECMSHSMSRHYNGMGVCTKGLKITGFDGHNSFLMSTTVEAKSWKQWVTVNRC